MISLAEIGASRLRAQQRYEDFRAETKAIERRRWAGIRAAEATTQHIKENYCQIYTCAICGKLTSLQHIVDECWDFKPADILPDELLRRKEDPFNDVNWDYEVETGKLAKVLDETV